jgi:hypothetical protein
MCPIAINIALLRSENVGSFWEEPVKFDGRLTYYDASVSKT